MEFIPAKEKNSFAKEWRKVLAKDHVIRIESYEVFNTTLVDIQDSDSIKEKIEKKEKMMREKDTKEIPAKEEEPA